MMISLGFALACVAGMTIKFFPLYFRCSARMSPAAVQGMYAGVPLLLALFARLGTASAKILGRIQVLNHRPAHTPVPPASPAA